MLPRPVALAAGLSFAPLLMVRAAEMPTDPTALLQAWADAYATNEGPRAGALYTEDARLWGRVRVCTRINPLLRLGLCHEPA